MCSAGPGDLQLIDTRGLDMEPHVTAQRTTHATSWKMVTAQHSTTQEGPKQLRLKALNTVKNASNCNSCPTTALCLTPALQYITHKP